MPADPVYVALQLFHQWSQVAAVCALLLALASFAMLAVSRRLAPSRASLVAGPRNLWRVHAGGCSWRTLAWRGG
jgi:hypothetical protein